jgi:hypothetical protein
MIADFDVDKASLTSYLHHAAIMVALTPAGKESLDALVVCLFLPLVIF